MKYIIDQNILPLYKKYFPNTKIILIFHNDPLSMRGSIKINERENIIDNTVIKLFLLVTWIQQKILFMG